MAKRMKPEHFTYQHHVVPKRKFRPIFFLGLVALFVVGLMSSRVIAKAVYNKQIAAIPKEQDILGTGYAEGMQKKTDVAKLAKVAEGLLKKNLPEYATLNFKRASDLDAEYRDAAYGWAYALLRSKGESLTDIDKKDIQTAIERAEAVDPHYLPLLNLKLLVAKSQNNQEIVSLTESRLKLLQP